MLIASPCQSGLGLDPSLQNDTSNSRHHLFLITTALVLCTFAVLPKINPLEWRTAAAIVEEPTAEKDKLVAQRLIPDQIALLGTKVTTLDLGPLLAETELGANGEPISVEILRAKDDVAEVSIDGLLLTLRWQKKTDKKRDILIRASVPSGERIDCKFYVKLWQPDYWKLLFTVVGGLGIFLLGMKNMSQGLQAVAGNGLRRMISWVTNNRLMAVTVGTLITMLVQSSSITTVMVVGFVNSAFMTLGQSIGVIMGANIGTTITGWILVLKIGKYGLPIAGAAAFMYLFAKRDRLRFLAMAIMGLGLIFFGLELMKDGFSVVKELPAFELWFQKFSADSYLGILQCAAVGCVLTFIVQSSSATLGITIGLAQLGVIEFETAAALVLGENIGTTITAWLASFGATTNAKRAAYFHVVFNLVGVAWITAIFHWYLLLIRWFIVGDPTGDLTVEATSAATVTAGIAATHTIFNVTNTILFLPICGYVANILIRLIPDRSKQEEQPRLTNLDVRMLESPAIAIEQSREEMLQMAKNAQTMMEKMKPIEESGKWTESQSDEILTMEEHQDAMQVEFIEFMSKLLATNLPHELVDEARSQIRLADEYESISDCIASVIKRKRYLEKKGLKMDKSERRDIQGLHQQVYDFMVVVNQAVIANDPKLLEDATNSGETITKYAKSLVKKLDSRPPAEQPTPFVSTSYARQVAAYRRVRDHLINITEVVMGQK